MALALKSGETQAMVAPLYRASQAKCASGMRVALMFDPQRTMCFALNQSAHSHASVWTPHVIGSPGGRSQYQS
jgi:hypothetical protein